MCYVKRVSLPMLALILFAGPLYPQNSVTGRGTANGGGAITSISPHYVALSWTTNQSNVAGYNIYRGAVSGGPYSKVNSALIVGMSYSDATVVAGQTYYYVTTVVNSGGTESAYSNQASATVPSP